MGDALLRVLREYNLLAAVFTAFLGMAIGLNWISLDNTQIGLVLAFIGAVLLLIRFAVTPTADPQLPVGTLVNRSSTTLPNSVVVSETELASMRANANPTAPIV